jgi:phenylacetate-CoA ligase
MIATHAHPSYLYGGGMIVSSAYEYFGLVNLWVPPPETDELAEKGIRAWMRFKPDIPFQGFSLGRYLEVCNKLGLDPVKDVGLKVHSDRPPQRRMPLVTAGMECFSHLGSLCEKGDGGHVSDDWAIVQAVDPTTGKEVPEGEWGNLVITTLDRDNGLLRYDLEEACAVTRRACGCGETTLRAWWGGRFKDLLTVQGKRLQPREVEDALRSVERVAKPSLEWVVVRPREDRAPLVVRVESAEGDSGEVARECVAALREGLGIDAQVEVLARNALPRSAYKANRVVDG